MNGTLISVYYYTDLIHVFRCALSNNFPGNHIYRLYLLGKDAPKEISIYSRTSASHYDLKSFNCLLYFMSISGIMQKIPECTVTRQISFPHRDEAQGRCGGINF